MRIILAGGTGFIGSALRMSLEAAGHEVAVLTRRPSAVPLGVQALAWDGRRLKGWAGKFDGADAVINLAGSSLARRWTPAVKEELLRSRVDAVRAVAAAIAQSRRKPSVLINASAVGYYGDGGQTLLTEESPSGEGFLPRVCRQWEQEALLSCGPGTRVVLLRLGVVLGRKGGALPRLALPFLLFAGGPLGSGEQWTSWVHLDDVLGVIDRALWDQSLAGPVNCCAPEPLRNADFSRKLGYALRRPSWLRMPAPLLRLVMGEGAEVVLASQRVLPAKLARAGFQFRYPRLEDALQALFKRRSRRARPAGVPSPSGR